MSEATETVTPEAPLTFEAAFAVDASSASDPASTSTTTPAAEQQETTAAATSPTAGESDDRSPFIPRTRFDEVNAERNTLRQWKEQRAWAEQINQEHFNTMAQVYSRAYSDPRGF